VKRKKIPEESPDFDDEWPAAKPPGKFKKKGREVIGVPPAEGEIWYLDGKFHALAGARSLALPPRPFSIAKQAAWLSLSRRVPHPQDDPEDLDRIEHQDRVAADSLAKHFAEAMLTGTLHTLARAVVKELDCVSRKGTSKENGDNRANGYLDALSAIAFKSTHPEQVTVKAIILHMENHRARYIEFGLIAHELKVRETRMGLVGIGFGWLEPGT